jgi:DNA-binding transcriptional ArsR family regulator
VVIRSAQRVAPCGRYTGQHLRVLAGAGLLSERREGTRWLYLTRPESLEPVREILADLWPDALQRLKLAVESRPET